MPYYGLTAELSSTRACLCPSTETVQWNVTLDTSESATDINHCQSGERFVHPVLWEESSRAKVDSFDQESRWQQESSSSHDARTEQQWSASSLHEEWRQSGLSCSRSSTTLCRSLPSLCHVQWTTPVDIGTVSWLGTIGEIPLRATGAGSYEAEENSPQSKNGSLNQGQLRNSHSFRLIFIPAFPSFISLVVLIFSNTQE